jgi:hypothetical protein
MIDNADEEVVLNGYFFPCNLFNEKKNLNKEAEKWQKKRN